MVPRRHCDGRRAGRARRARSTSGSTCSSTTSSTTSFWYGVSRTRPLPCCSTTSASRVEQRAAHPPDGRGDADVRPAVGLAVHADVVAGRRSGPAGPGRRPAAGPGTRRTRASSRNASGAPVGDQELEPGPGPQPPVAVVAEDPHDPLPHLGHVLERHPRAEPLGQHRVGRQPAADPHVEARPVLGVVDADERHVVARRERRPGSGCRRSRS